MSKIKAVQMWRDEDGHHWDTEELATTASIKIDKKREHARKQRIIDKHITLCFDDWLKYTEHDKACDMRQGASKLIWYLITKDLLRPEVYDVKD